jgi:phage FluMu protein Com
MSVKSDRSKKNYVSCPCCGKPLFRGRVVEGMEIQCPRCKSGLLIQCTDGMVQVKEAEMEYSTQA